MSNTADFIMESDHAGFLPESISHMEDAEIELLLGVDTVRNYANDHQLKTNEAYSPTAKQTLSRMRKITFLLDRIDAHAEALRLEPTRLVAFNGFVEKRIHSNAWFNNIFDDAFGKEIEEIQGLCRYFRAVTSSEKNASAQKATKLLGNLCGCLQELNEHSSFFRKNAQSTEVRTLYEIEKKTKEEKVACGDPLNIDCCLRSAQRLADTRLFGLEEILKEALGGEKFPFFMKKNFSELMRINRKARANEYHESYIRLSTKYFKRFVNATLGVTAFSFNNGKDVADWTAGDVCDLREFVQSRYSIVHNVTEGIFNKEKNPLGTNFSKKQTLALMGETLRSSLYSNYKLDIRVGIGGTEEKDVLLRLGSYVMNAMDILSLYEAANEICANKKGVNTPTLTIVSGAALAERVNGLDPVVGQQNEQNMFGYLKEFISFSYPEIKGGITFSSPKQENIFENDLYKSLLIAAKEVVNASNRPSSAWTENAENESQACAAVKALTSFATKRASGNESGAEAQDRAMQYAVGHVMPCLFQSVCSRGEYVPPVWKIGGRSERHFDAFGEALVSLIQDDLRFSLPNANNGTSLLAGICTTTTVGGNPPPYYRGSSDSFDMGLREFMTSFRNGTVADEKIIKRLQTDKSGPANDLHALLKHPRFGDGDISRGWQKYRSFLVSCER